MSSSDADEAVGRVRTAWKRAEPNHSEYGLTVAELNSSQMVENCSVFERGNHVPVIHLAYFKPPASSFLSELRAKDRRSAKEWEYVNAGGVWVELGQTALDLALDGESVDKMEGLARRLALAEKAFAAAREVLAMRAQYFHDIVGHGVEAARQMSFLVQQGHDAVHSSSHKSVRESLSQRLEAETAKMLAKTYLERATGTRSGGDGGAGGGTGDGGAGSAAGSS
jgi:hypothetical protein